jgi:hypothetical protein
MLFYDVKYREKYNKPVVECTLDSNNFVEKCDMYLRGQLMEANGLPTIELL